ncbi:MAG TPA: peptidoglycan-binding domain-containing protein [Candidatus Binataceae bacterium]|nr:peptidoglycan-binding domain-containing protein [Candidatus Binataceae bacterium]
MATYCCGAQGPEVASIQQKLKDAGIYNGPIDGIFGGGTESAVRAFQRRVNLTADGIVDPATWAKLFAGAAPGETEMKQPAITAEPLALRCLALTGSFETALPLPDCFAGLSGNFDGQGISFGVCQWNLGQNSLQPLFSELSDTEAKLVDAIFHDYAAEFRKMIASPHEEQMEWASSIQDARHNLVEPWLGLFKSLGRTPEFQAIQASHASRLFQGALDLCHEFDVGSERAAALMFDIKVQNGSISDLVRTQIERDYAGIPADEAANAVEALRLQIIANRRAQACNPQWVADVRNRKLTIANGAGTVHGRHYDLEAQYGIRLGAFAPA